LARRKVADDQTATWPCLLAASAVGQRCGMITDVALMIVILGTVTLALAVDVAAAIGWIRNRRR